METRKLRQKKAKEKSKFKSKIYEAVKEEYSDLMHTKDYWNSLGPYLNKCLTKNWFKLEDKKLLLLRDYKGNILKNPNVIPLKSVCYEDYPKSMMVKQEVYRFDEYNDNIWLKNKKGRMYPAKMALGVDTSGISFALETNTRVWAYIIPEASFLIIHFEIEEKEEKQDTDFERHEITGNIQILG